ncbi:DUF481 domain-containing protein [Occallatibacter riparius]|uniref:DUF481 domain-containing protein n=1 Tax=Occallatibacter riparius TaxID=1002689 RepID=A0A9J7BMC4_9BACT|nr:DUF481 domain-containing protein [Occallatibacter riparius]UWZ82062.1 DUF481 domain-containing protein [Occallatibacter riparius]
MLFTFVSATALPRPAFASGAAAGAGAPDATGDVLVLSNGDTLHGKLVKVAGGKVTFHSEALGDVDVSWDHVKEMHSADQFGVLQKGVKLSHKKGAAAQIPTGSVDVANQSITLHAADAAPTPASIPVANAAYVVDTATIQKQFHEPSFFKGWNGAATAGATLVQATQNQYTVSGALSLVRLVPTVNWLDPRNRTMFDFQGSYGKITEPGVPTTKSAIFHIDAERDQYFSPKMYALAQTAFDHNFAQNLQLQQIYGGGLGWTLFSTPRHEADVKGTVQYERQQFITGTTGTTEDLIGSTFAFNYILHTKPFTYTQELAYIPSYNVPRAYSANETNTVAFTAYKNFGFSVGTIDSYLNNPPATVPATKRNSFQFTMGLTYAIKSQY